MLELSQIESFYPEHLRPFKRNLLREYMQYKILEIIYSSEVGQNLIFMGGTAMHIVHGLPRFSEDLDFDNVGLDRKSFSNLSNLIQKRLGLQGYKIEIENSFKGAYRSYIRVADVLYDNKLSGHKEEKMFIQLDTEPQNFSYRTDKIIINKFDVLIRVNVVPLKVLLSQKIFAVFRRKRPMGRDFYDAIFLFGKTKPDYGYLKSKLKIDNLSDLKKELVNRCERVDLKLLAKDVEQFLFIPDDAKKVEIFSEYVKSMPDVEH